MDVRRAVYAELKTFTNLGSQIGDTRPLSSLRFSPDSSMLLTSSWTGAAKLWSIPACKEIKTLKGALAPCRICSSRIDRLHSIAHKERIGGVAWHPQATLSQSRSAVNFATSGADNDIKLWGLERYFLPHSMVYSITDLWFYLSDAPLLTLSGHSARVCRIAYHPSGKYIGSASYDGTWRLWDAERGGEELLLQEGHSKEVYAIEFQEDGALVCTGCGLPSLALRSPVLTFNLKWTRCDWTSVGPAIREDGHGPRRSRQGHSRH